MNKTRFYIIVIFVSLLLAAGVQTWRIVFSSAAKKEKPNPEEYYPLDRAPQDQPVAALEDSSSEGYLGDYSAEIALQPSEDTDGTPRPVMNPTGKVNLTMGTDALTQDGADAAAGEEGYAAAPDPEAQAATAAENDKIDMKILQRYANIPVVRQFNAQMEAILGEKASTPYSFLPGHAEQPLDPRIKDLMEKYAKNPEFVAAMNKMLADEEFLQLLNKYTARFADQTAK